ncbi:MAG: succinate dehydrogenase assembly factor 2 [Pseudomonadota bacterium]|nr:succinate dehydrogenase assembly factor 2 [Pseudomonadota bacterium]
MIRAEIEWRLRRSILELDVLMRSFFDTCYESLSQQERQEFEALLLLEDPDLFARIFSETQDLSTLISKLRVHQVNRVKK